MDSPFVDFRCCMYFIVHRFFSYLFGIMATGPAAGSSSFTCSMSGFHSSTLIVHDYSDLLYLHPSD